MKTKILFLSAILLLSSGCANSDDLSKDGNAANPTENQATDFSLPEGCTWKRHTEQSNVYVIRSVEDILPFIDGEFPESLIDFGKYSLIYARGMGASGIDSITKQLQKTSENEYLLYVEITNNDTEIAPLWNIAVLVPLIPQNAEVSLSVNALPKGISWVQIAQENLYGNGKEGFSQQGIAIKTGSEWEAFKQKMNTTNNVVGMYFTETEVDFSAYQIIAVFDEVKGSGGWTIDITGVTELQDKIVVSVTNLKKGNGLAVMTQPFQIVKIPVSEKEVEFDIEKQESYPDTTVLPSCELKTMLLKELEFEATILKKRPEGDFSSPYIVWELGKDEIYLIQQYTENARAISRICNFPQYTQDWDIPEEGLTVILNGKFYDYDGIVPDNANLMFYDLELLTIKKKLPTGIAESMVADNKAWHVDMGYPCFIEGENTGCFCYAGLRTFRAGNHKIFNGKEYTEILSNSINIPNEWTTETYLREASKQVFFYSEKCGKEFLMYDFDLQVGDKVILNDYYVTKCNLSEQGETEQEYLYTVTEVDSVAYNQVKRKYLKLEGEMHLFWIEGVGDIQMGLLYHSAGWGGAPSQLKDCYVGDYLFFLNDNPRYCFITTGY